MLPLLPLLPLLLLKCVAFVVSCSTAETHQQRYYQCQATFQPVAQLEVAVGDLPPLCPLSVVHCPLSTVTRRQLMTKYVRDTRMDFG